MKIINIDKKFNKDLTEGILYDNKNKVFTFNFNTDTEKDVIHLSSADLTIDTYNDKVYVFGYKLRDEGINSSAFVSWLKKQFDDNKSTAEINKFIYNSIDKLHRKFNLNNFKCIIYPDITKNKLVKKIVRLINDTIYDFEAPITYYSIIKNLPSKIKFDWAAFKEDHEVLYEPRNKKQRLEIEDKIHKLLDKIHHLEYFKLHESGFDVNQRKYLRNFLTIDEKQDYAVLKNLVSTDLVLLVDDAYTTGTTINEMLRAISTVNSDCKIIIFTLIKGKDDNF